MEYFKNLSLVNITEEIDGIVYVEEWKDVYGYEGLYQISSFGRLKSLAKTTICRWGRNQKREERIIRQSFDKDCYLHIMLHCDGERKTKRVHRLVGQHFIENEFNKPEINHLFGVRTNNFYKKLEWSTTKENINHSFQVLGKTPNTTGRFGKDSIASKMIKCCTLDICFDSVTEAANTLGLCGANISMVLKNKRPHTHGLVFRYI